MPRVKVYNQEGAVVREQELDPFVFGVPAQSSFLHEIVVSLQANRRRNTAQTKDRGEVRGGGKKPWKQKGTGRARHGSIRSPLWRGGGVTFGPRTERNYTKKINAKARQLALRMCLSDKVLHDQFVLLDSLDLAEKKTKAAHGILERLHIPLQKRRAALVVLGEERGVTGRSLRNIPSLFVSRTNNLNVLDLLRYPYLVTTPEAVQKIIQLFGKKEKGIV